MSYYGKYLQSFYLVCQIIVFVCIWKSNHDQPKLIYPAIIIVAFRNTLPLLDLDNDQGMFKAGTDVYMIIGQMTASTFGCLMMASLQIKKKFVYLTSITLLSYFGLLRNLYSTEELITNIIFVTVIPTVVSIF